jgi:UDP:flavonoid glycosyltransferase YjiC (YdhE family)
MRRMRIAFASNPALGHVLPLIPLARAAQDAGHDVRVLGGASLAAPLAGAGLPHVVAGPPDLPTVFARVPEREGLTGRRLAAVTWRRAFAGIIAEEMVAGLLDLARSWNPDIVVHEDSEQGSWIAAERVGIPHVALQATAWRGNSYRLSSDPLNVLLAALGLPEDPDLARWHRFGFLTTRPPALHNPDDPMPAGTRPIRPTASDEAGGEPATWPGAAGEVRPRVVVTMGTLMPGRPEAMTAILDGLEPLGVDIIATVGHDLAPAALGRRRASTRVARYVPMSALVAGASLLVFHGGSGTMLAGLAAGVPLVILPIAADQPENAERCLEAGAARVLPLDDRGPARVCEAAADVLSDPAFRASATRIARQIEDMPEPAAVLPWLEELATRGGGGEAATD